MLPAIRFVFSWACPATILMIAKTNIGMQSVQDLFCGVIGACTELFTVMIWLSSLVAMYSTKETGKLYCTYNDTSVMVR